MEKKNRGKLHKKTGEKALKMHLFRLLPQKNSWRGLRPARRKLISRGKELISKEGGGGNDQKAQYIPLVLKSRLKITLYPRGAQELNCS